MNEMSREIYLDIKSDRDALVFVVSFKLSQTFDGKTIIMNSWYDGSRQARHDGLLNDHFGLLLILQLTQQSVQIVEGAFYLFRFCALRGNKDSSELI